jgi:hypothetical protein
MPTPEQVRELVDSGGFALFVFTVIAGVIGLWRRIVVFGWFFDQERASRMRAEAENRTLVVSLARMTGELKALRDELKRERSGRA